MNAVKGALTALLFVFFAQNPVNENEMVFTTFNNNVYLSNNKGAGWTKIGLREGNFAGKSLIYLRNRKEAII